MMFDYKFYIYFAWMGVVLFALSFLSGAPEPFLGYVVVMLIMVLPLAIMDRLER